LTSTLGSGPGLRSSSTGRLVVGRHDAGVDLRFRKRCGGSRSALLHLRSPRASLRTPPPGLALIDMGRSVRRAAIPLHSLLCECADLLSGHRRAPSGSASRHLRCLHHHKPGTRGPGGAATQEGRRRSTAMLPWPWKSSAICTATTIFRCSQRTLKRLVKGNRPRSALPTIVINGADITHRQLSADSGPSHPCR
jgi:hypothetical protein